MTILLDNYKFPAKGHVQIDVAFDIVVSADEARQTARQWLANEISMLVDADPPLLVVGEKIHWRVPAYISFPDMGRVDVIGTVVVDANAGKIVNAEKSKTEILQYLEERIKPKLPPDQFAARKVPARFIPTDIPQAEQITLPEK